VSRFTNWPLNRNVLIAPCPIASARPALSLAGEMSPIRPSVETWRRAKPDAEIVVLSAAEHDMTLPDGTIDPEYERRLVEWLSALG